MIGEYFAPEAARVVEVMMTIGLIGLVLVLIGVVGLQSMYLFYIDRVFRERQRYLQQLEKRHSVMAQRLKIAEMRVSEQESLLAQTYFERVQPEELWADVIDEK